MDSLWADEDARANDAAHDDHDTAEKANLRLQRNIVTRFAVLQFLNNLFLSITFKKFKFAHALCPCLLR